MKRKCVPVLVAAVVCIGSLVVASPEDDRTDKNHKAVALIEPCVSLAGANSGITKREIHRITKQDDWIRLWQKHKGLEVTGEYDFHYDPAGLPLVDFQRYMVIAIFQGSGWNSARAKAVSIEDQPEQIVVRYDDKGYQTFGPDGGGDEVTPYGIFVVPRSNKAVAVGEMVRQYKNEAPKWEQRAVFPKLEPAKQDKPDSGKFAIGDDIDAARKVLDGFDKGYGEGINAFAMGPPSDDHELVHTTLDEDHVSLFIWFLKSKRTITSITAKYKLSWRAGKADRFGLPVTAVQLNRDGTYTLTFAKPPTLAELEAQEKEQDAKRDPADSPFACP